MFYRSGLAQRVGIAAATAAVAYGGSKNPRMSAAAGIGESPGHVSDKTLQAIEVVIRSPSHSSAVHLSLRIFIEAVCTGLGERAFVTVA